MTYGGGREGQLSRGREFCVKWRFWRTSFSSVSSSVSSSVPSSASFSWSSFVPNLLCVVLFSFFFLSFFLLFFSLFFFSRRHCLPELGHDWIHPNLELVLVCNQINPSFSKLFAAWVVSGSGSGGDGGACVCCARSRGKKITEEKEILS